jgi:glutathione S-transferase
LALDDGSVLLEAAAIAQYIADRDSTGKLAPPHGTIERARLQAWLNFLSSEIHKGGLGPLFYTALDERAEDIFRERLRARFAFVDQHLSTREYLLGKDYSIADAGLYAMTGWTPRVGFDIHASRTWSRITLGSPIATLYVKFIGSRGLSRHDPWTVRFGYQASRGRFVRSWHIASFRCAAEFGRYRGIADIDRTAPIKLNCPGRTGGPCSSLIVPAIATSCRTDLRALTH